jgi:peptidoglycan/xylan/chitin deacetylase (PgdA/CDA1 family)
LTSVARQVLQPRGIQGLAFVVTGPTSNEWDQAWGAAPIDLLTREQHKELVELGIEIGSHSRTHREMRQLDDVEQEAETAGSLKDLARDGLPPPRFFAYPYGATDDRSRAAVNEAGFQAAFGLQQRRLHRGSNRFDLPRVIVLAADRGWRFRAKTAAPRLFNLYTRALRRLGVVIR